MSKLSVALIVMLCAPTVGMEREDTSWADWFGGSSFTKDEPNKYVPERIIGLRDKRRELEDELFGNDSSLYRLGRLAKLMITQVWHGFDGPLKNPKILLLYIYYWKHHTYKLDSLLSNLNKSGEFSAVQKYELDGYSAIGAALVAKDIEREEKRKVVKTLLSFEFKPTVKDLDLDYLELWEWTQNDSRKKLLLYIGSIDKGSTLYGLPLEIIVYISNFMLPDEEPILSRKFFKNSIVKPQNNNNET